MNDTALQSTLRQMQALMRDGRSWMLLALMGLIAGLVGPFGTYEAVPLVPRVLYWIAVIIGTGAMGTLVAGLAERRLKTWFPLSVAALIGGALAGPPITAVVALVNLLAFGPDTPIGLLTLLVYCTAIAAAVTLLSALLDMRPKASEAEVAAAIVPNEPALVERLPRPQRGRLLHIAVSDHYVDVSTEKGTTLVLMRLSDAIRETAPEPGLQVHRSHWVALAAVRRGFRQGGKPVLELENGTVVPVSRTFVDAVKAAGLLG
ncbi:LytTR family DNA-binding domain-containing protein [Devosia sp. Leaf64]|uniref:LytTR family DNA-binding domain-containing protein n=1 Tax=Devosia sp. Leaf64 TaxID=1736229 RepID=UPI0012E2AF37|nr:LytTR family DNA-binding domain-containing protein [Devosia sp. Leaf64]